MLLKIILKYILGYVRVMVEGYYIERLINICTSDNILIWNLKRESSVRLYLNLGISDFKKISKIAKKTKCRLKIESRYGIPFIINRYRKRKIFVALLIIVLISVFVSSLYIWNIDIKEESGVNLYNIENDLKEAGLSVGKLKNKINTKDIINKIRLKRNDIAWIGVEIKGTNAIVRIVKSDQAPEIINDEDYCNIIANKSGLITKINAQNGTVRVKEGDVVQKNDLLIEGIMEGKFTNPRYVHAIGEIEAKVWYTKSKKIYNKMEELTKTGKEEKCYSIKIHNFEINFSKKLSKFELYDTIKTENKIKIFSNLFLPISVIKTTYQELEKTEKEYDDEEIINIGKKELEQELENEISHKENILRSKM